MGPLLHASAFSAALCLAVALYLLYQRNSLWKKFACGFALCLALFLSATYLGNTLRAMRPPPVASPLPKAELIKYTVQSLNAPTELQLQGWRRGVLCPLTYTIAVEKNDPSEAEFARIAEDLVEKDAKGRQNWNLIYFYLKTPANAQSGAPYLSGMYALGGGAEESNKVKPGEYTGKYRFILSRN